MRTICSKLTTMALAAALTTAALVGCSPGSFKATATDTSANVNVSTGITLQFEVADALTVKALSRKPALAIWGMADQTLQPEHFIPLFTEAFPNGKTHYLKGVGHYCHEDAPETISKLLDEFLQQT